MQLEPFVCNLDPITKTTLKMYLFENVQNMDEVYTNILKGNWKCAVMNPSLILNPLQVATAVNKAVVAQHQNTMITKTVYTECIFNLAVGTSISSSLSTFGIQSSNKDILICFLVNPEEDDSKDILDKIDGNVCPISDLNKFSNIKEIKNVYKLKDLKCDDFLLKLILTKIATKQIC